MFSLSFSHIVLNNYISECDITTKFKILSLTTFFYEAKLHTKHSVTKYAVLLTRSKVESDKMVMACENNVA